VGGLYRSSGVRGKESGVAGVQEFRGRCQELQEFRSCRMIFGSSALSIGANSYDFELDYNLNCFSLYFAMRYSELLQLLNS
jgi:hypothetical protein